MALVSDDSPGQVIVVEDFDPFRRFLCSSLAKIPGLQVVGELSDGIEAVRRAGELQPDLILLDVGLLSLNRIEAARQIRSVSPKSQILFVSQESDADVVQEALSLASGYVVKTRWRRICYLPSRRFVAAKNLSVPDYYVTMCPKRGTCRPRTEFLSNQQTIEPRPHDLCRNASS
jgi:CheY-like chemotaxis protein